MFCGGFLERAAKRLEEEKALAKVTRARHGGGPPPKRQHPAQDPNNLRCFLERVPLQGTAAAISSASSCAKDNSKRTQRAKARSHTASEIGTSSRHHCTHRQFGMFTQDFKSYFAFVRSSPYGPAPTLYCQLAEHNNRPMGAAGGQRIHLVSAPIQMSQQVAMATRNDQDLVGQEVQKLLDKGAIKIIDPCPNQYLSRIFLVPKRDGSFRPVVNLKPLNQFRATVHFKMESLAMMKDLLREGDWMASIDLKDAYLLVAIWEGHRKYLGFTWKHTLYEFQCLPFGLSSAPRIFTKLLKPVLARLRQSRCSADHVFRRHADDGTVSGGIGETASAGYIPSGTVGVRNQPREVTAAAHTVDSIPRLPN